MKLLTPKRDNVRDSALVLIWKKSRKCKNCYVNSGLNNSILPPNICVHIDVFTLISSKRNQDIHRKLQISNNLCYNIHGQCAFESGRNFDDQSTRVAGTFVRFELANMKEIRFTYKVLRR